MNRRVHQILLLVITLQVVHGCASLTTPNGGPKDKEPPLLVKSTPKNNEINFTGKVLTLDFNEPIKLNNPREEIVISPPPGKGIEYKAKGNQVIIVAKRPWKDSTTYNIQFREAVQDQTEGNSSVNTKLAFSTSHQIDSVHLTGHVYDLLKGTDLEKATVALYVSDTFNIFSDTAVYTTKTTKKGVYRIDNIKAGTYYLYAFDDKNKNQKVESQAERYGYRIQPLNLTSNQDSVPLSLIMVDSRKLKISSVRNVGHLTRIRFSKLLDSYTLQPDSSIVHAFGDSQNEINLWNPDKIGDTLHLKITARDSLQNRVDTLIYLTRLEIKSPKDGLRWSLGSPVVESETGNFHTTLTFNKPITNISPDSLYLRIDTVATIPFTIKELTINQQLRAITATKQIDPRFFKGAKDPIIKLYAGKELAYSIDGDTTKATSTSVTQLWPEDTGIILIQVETKEKHYIIQLLDQSGKIVESVIDNPHPVFRNVTPQDYQLRIIVDKNANARWDTGNIAFGTEPEPVFYYKTPKNKPKFTMRANWENGPLILRF